MSEANYLDIPLVWSTLLARLTGIDPDHDAEVIRSFCETFDIPARVVLAKVRTHLGYSYVKH